MIKFDLLLQNASVLQSNGTIEKKSVLINNGIIQEIVEDGSLRNSEFTEIIDCEECVITPGLVNAHCHSGMALLRGWADDLCLQDWLNKRVLPYEDMLTDTDIYWSSLASIGEMLLNGITAFADQYFHIEQTAKAVIESGIRARLSRGLVAVGDNPEIGFSDRLAENIQLFENFNGADSGRLLIDFGPHAIYSCPLPYMEKAFKAAEKVGAKIQLHLAETIFEIELTKKTYDGLTPVKLLKKHELLSKNVVAAHCVHVDDDEIEILAESNVNVVHCPSSNAKLASGCMPLPKLLKAGVNVTLGTDGVASNNNLNLLNEMRLSGLIQKTVNCDAAIIRAGELWQLATKNGYSAVELNGGSIRKGEVADIVIWDENKLYCQPAYDFITNAIYSMGGDCVKTVIVDGKIIVRNRELVNIDIEKTINYIKKRSREISNKLNS